MSFFWGGGIPGGDRPKFEAEVRFLAEGQRAPSHQLRGLRERCKLPSRLWVWARRQIHCGLIKSLENMSSGHKCRTQFIFFTEHWRSRGILRYHWCDPLRFRRTPVQKHCTWQTKSVTIPAKHSGDGACLTWWSSSPTSFSSTYLLLQVKFLKGNNSTDIFSSPYCAISEF